MEKYQIRKLLTDLGLDVSEQEGILFAQTDDETLAIEFIGEGQWELDYLCMDYPILTRKTLEGCPPVIEHWKDRLAFLSDDENYVQTPYFCSSLDDLNLVDVCFYLGSKMVENSSADSLHNSLA